jgi:GT2 family glycosyltransferase/2-polyprenyl-3-methyl-5-hydroxy-6-metoxy-1,4-benzoquinol methylase/tetratricopeptide (TPR) repeat protein
MTFSDILVLSGYPPGVFQYGIEKALTALGHRVFTAGAATSLLAPLEQALQRHEPGYRYGALVAPDAPLADVLAQCPFAPDLILYLDAGTPCLPSDLHDAPCPVVGLLAEDIINADIYSRIIPYFDLALVTWKSTEKRWRDQGHDNVRQWYYGARPDFCIDEGLPRIHDVAFLGNLNPQVQRRRLHAVQKLLRLRDEGIRVYVGGNLYFADYNRIQCQSKIVYHQGITDQVNMRVFEAMGAGCLVVMRRPQDPDDPTTHFFRDRENVVYCDTDDEALDLIRYYLCHDTERQRIADAGHRTVMAKHNYVDVVRTLMTDILPALPSDVRGTRRSRLARTAKDERRRRLDFAWVYYALGVAQASLRQIAALGDAGIRDAETVNVLGVLHATVGNFDVAVDQLRRACALDPPSLVTRTNLALVALAAGRPEADRWCDEALECLAAADPADMPATAIEGPHACADYNRFRLEVARAYLDHATPAARATALVRLYRYRLHQTRAERALGCGAFDRAAADIEHALALVPDDGYLLHRRAQAAVARGAGVADVLSDLERAIALEPFFAQAKHDYACALEALGRTEDAFTEYRDLVRHNPMFQAPPEMWRRVAELALTVGRIREAREAVDAGLAVAPDDAGLAALRSEVELVSSTGSAERASIVVPLGDDASLVQRALTSLVEHTAPHPYELIVIRRAPNRAVDAFLKLLDAPIKVVASSGSAAGDYVRAASAATGTHLVFLDVRVVVQESWLPSLLAAVSGTTIAVPLVLDEAGRGSASPTLAFCVRRDVWESVGGLDTRASLEVALEGFCEKVRLAGGSVAIVEESRVRSIADAAIQDITLVASAPAASSTPRPHGMRHVPPPPAGYFDFARPEVADLVPADARRVLDVGCGGGALGALLKQRPGVEVTGLEGDERAAALARTRLDRVITVDLDAMNEPPLPKGYFDCIIFADVLEHLSDPEQVLTGLLPYLHERGTIVASIPNVRHQDVVLDLLVNGRWQYQPAGILDATHLRFFTLHEIAAMFDRLGLQIHDLRASGSPPNPELDAVADVVARLGGDRARFVQEAQVIQYIFRARPRRVPRVATTSTGTGAGQRPRVSIVVLAWNELLYTRECLASIQACTRMPYELVLVDNGSTDETLQFFRSVPGAKVIANGANLGFAGGNNRGILAATGDYIVILNNDTLVTDGWLEGLLACADEDPAIGIVGPMSNYVSGPQLVADAAYADFAALQTYAAEFRARHRGRRIDTNRLVGFCMLMKRDVVVRVGLLDESFGLGNFEDDDYCLRARRAGFRLVIAGDVFIHHFGSRTFLGQGVDFAEAMRHGRKVFERKWSANGTAATEM